MNDDDDDFDESENYFKKRLPALFAWFLLLSTSASYYCLVLPNIPAIIGNNIYLLVSISAFQGFIFFCVIVNFLIATLLDPGRFPKVNLNETQGVALENLSNATHKTVLINDISVRMKWCTTCKFFRPPRSSHCAICDYCIDTMDHHCPWLCNCVGKRNYKFFLQFLVSLSVHMINIFILCLLLVLWNKDNIMNTPVIAAIVLIVIVSILFIPIGGLTGFHLVLVSRGRTTNEQVTGKFRSGVNPFDMGFFTNWKRALCSSLSPNLIDYYMKYAQTSERNLKKLKAAYKKLNKNQIINQNDVRVHILAESNKLQTQSKHTSKPIYFSQYTSTKSNSNNDEKLYLNELKKENNTTNNRIWIDRKTNEIIEANKLLSTNSIRNDSYLNANNNRTNNNANIHVVNLKTKNNKNTNSLKVSKRQSVNGTNDYASYEITV